MSKHDEDCMKEFPNCICLRFDHDNDVCCFKESHYKGGCDGDNRCPDFKEETS